MERLHGSLRVQCQLFKYLAESLHPAYRSELASILVARTVINALASFHNLNATITLHCDCERGIGKAFSQFRPIQIQDASHDLLKAIHNKLSQSHIKWSGAHIKGHQDNTVPFDKLDHPSQLNVLVDKMAKDFPATDATAMESNRHYNVYSHSWSLRLGHIPNLHELDQTIYDLVHTPLVKQYWMRKSRISENNFMSVNWKCLGKALDKM
jgi:hypothetical protein